MICKRHRAKVEELKMANLPLERLEPDLPAFTNVDVDYFGPVEIKRGRSTLPNNYLFQWPQDLKPLPPKFHLVNTKPILPPGVFDKAIGSRCSTRQTYFQSDGVRNIYPSCKRGKNGVNLVVNPSAPCGAWILRRFLEVKAESNGLVRADNQHLPPARK